MRAVILLEHGLDHVEHIGIIGDKRSLAPAALLLDPGVGQFPLDLADHRGGLFDGISPPPLAMTATASIVTGSNI
jgi:hypothetical protein